MELRNFFKKNQIKDIAKKEQDFYPNELRDKIFENGKLKENLDFDVIHE